MKRSLLIFGLYLVLSGLVHAAEREVTTSFTEGMRYYDAQDYQAAAKAFKAAATADPANDEYVYWLGKAYWGCGFATEVVPTASAEGPVSWVIGVRGEPRISTVGPGPSGAAFAYVVKLLA